MDGGVRRCRETRREGVLEEREDFFYTLLVTQLMYTAWSALAIIGDGRENVEHASPCGAYNRNTNSVQSLQLHSKP